MSASTRRSHHWLRAAAPAAAAAVIVAAIPKLRRGFVYFPYTLFLYLLRFSNQRIREGRQPSTVTEWFFYGSQEPNYKVDITEVSELKGEATCQHINQMGNEI